MSEFTDVSTLPLLAAALLATSTPVVAADDVASTVRARQWQLDALRLPSAWRASKGSGVLVAVLDTGVDPRHPDLKGAVVEGPDLTGGGAADGQWGHHGTAMASLIAGRGHGPGKERGVMGVAPNAKVLSVRVTLENGDPRRVLQRAGGGNALAKGIRYAVDRGADVISMSLGGGSGTWKGSKAENDAVRYALERGAVLVASSGNDGATTNRRNFPAAYSGVIAVGAVDRQLRAATFSNRQDYVSVVAPGTEIVGADGPASYVIGDGTSPAAALVAGIAALIRSRHPQLSPAQVREAIERGTRCKPGQGRTRTLGYGLADAQRALKHADNIARRGVTQPALGPTTELLPSPEPPISRLLTILAMILLVAGMSIRVIAKR